jgi:hypothetical protein
MLLITNEGVGQSTSLLKAIPTGMVLKYIIGDNEGEFAVYAELVDGSKVLLKQVNTIERAKLLMETIADAEKGSTRYLDFTVNVNADNTIT